MDNLPTWTWAVPLFAALIALVGVIIGIYIQLRNLKRQLKSAHTLKLAEMRQAWINNLREAMINYQSYGITPNSNHTEIREYYEAGTRIELLMNPNDPEYKDLIDSLYTFLEANNKAEKYSANPRYIEICQRILKREWEVLKKEVHGFDN
jgi:hypothetical protein